MAQLGVTPTDVANAHRARRTRSTPPARSAQSPRRRARALVYTVTARGRLVEPEEFGEHRGARERPGGVLRLKDVARVELGALSYDASPRSTASRRSAWRSSCSPARNALEVADVGRAQDGAS